MHRFLLTVAAVFLAGIAADLPAQDAAGFFNRGKAWYAKGEFDMAITSYNEALRLYDPKDATSIAIICGNRGKVWKAKGDYEQAISDFDQALRLYNPRDTAYIADAHNDRGEIWRIKGEWEKAIADHREALVVEPKNVDACNALAWLQATCPDEKYRDGKAAFENASKAYRLTRGTKWYCVGTLAAAYAENGDFDAAKQWQEKAIEMAAKDPSATGKYKQAMRERLELYKQGKPCRQEPVKQ